MALGNSEQTVAPDAYWSDWLTKSVDVFASLADKYEQDGFVVVENVLDEVTLERVRDALAPHLSTGPKGRNEFEGRETNRVYALLDKGDVFAELSMHPLALSFVEHDLSESALLSAFLAINLKEGETAQPWHTDDGHISLPKPRNKCGVSVFWAIDAMTDENGATEIIPGSHRWSDEDPNGALTSDDFSTTLRREGDPGARADAVKATMPAGSMMALKGDVWHRGGANQSDAPRLILTPQYCAGWARPLESMLLAVPPEKAGSMPTRVQELLGYSIHPPFMGYVDGRHPRKVL
ncbi:MAG: phytanoyl-CoA dioxygenase family protein [Pseudomonadota bacterium]